MVRPDVGCRLWFGTLIDVLKVPSGSSSSVFIRLSTSDLVAVVVADPKKKKDSKKKLIVKCRDVFPYKLSKKNIVEASPVDSSIQDALSQVDFQDLPLLRFEILVNATDNFCEANQLGKGGFGPVYKGKLSDGTEIVVKRLSQASKQGMQEFMNEVVLISKLQHKNLVRLLGCCTEHKETMLINKSLDFYFFGLKFMKKST
ncbi:hypothetical protein ACS0TY_021125 [Phlomoides rotata]